MHMKTINITEQHALLNALLVTHGTQLHYRKGIRNHCLACLMLEAGLRVGEVVKLRIGDLWFGKAPVATLIITSDVSKTGIEGEVPVSTRLQKAIINLHKVLWEPNQRPANAFAMTWKNANHPMTTRQVERIIRDAAIRSIGRPVHPHVLRHTFATKLMRVTDLRTVQELLRHKRITSTQVYTHPDSTDMRTAIDRLNDGPCAQNC